VKLPAKTLPVAAFLLFGCLLGYNLWGGSLYNSDDCIYASMAREVYETGELLELSYQGELLFEKPPLLFWSIAAGFTLFGIGDFAARLPAALAGLALLWVVYLTVADYSREGTQGRRAGMVGGLAACVLLMASEFYYFNARRVMTDLPFWCFVLAFFRLLVRNRDWKDGLFAGLLAGLAVMTKGPAFGPPLVAGLVAFFWLGIHRTWGWRGCGAFVGVGLAVAGWWHLVLIVRHSTEFLGSYLGYHTLARVTSSLVNQSTPSYYLELLWDGEGAVWTFLFVAGLVALPVMAFRTRLGGDLLLSLFGLSYAFLITVMETRLPHYVLPLLAVGAVGVGRGVSWTIMRWSAPWLPAALTGLLLAAGAATFAVHNGYDLLSSEYSPDLKRLSGKVAEAPGPVVAFNDYNVVTYWYTGRPVRLWGTDSHLCRVMESIDMLARTDYVWCPPDVRQLAGRIRAMRPVLLTRRDHGVMSEVRRWLRRAGVEGRYRQVVAGSAAGFIPSPASTSPHHRKKP